MLCRIKDQTTDLERNTVEFLCMKMFWCIVCYFISFLRFIPFTVFLYIYLLKNISVTVSRHKSTFQDNHKLQRGAGTVLKDQDGYIK